MDIGKIIGLNLNKLRMERNLSLGQLAESSHISKVMLSQIEKGDTNPTINTIWKIANGLRVPYTVLLEQPEHGISVISKGDALKQTNEGEHYRIYCYYENTPQRDFEMFQIELDPGCETAPVTHSAKSYEYVMVLEGELLVTVGEDRYSLRRDDAVSFASDVPHTYAAAGDKMLRAIVVNHYPG